MNVQYEVRLYRPGDEEEIIPLLKLVFPGWRGIDFWKWMYEENYLKTNLITVATAEGRVVGASLSIPLRIKIGEGTYLSTYGSDVAVHPDYRRMGIHNRMVELKKELMVRNGVRINYAHTFNPIVIEHFVRGREENIELPHPISFYRRITDIDMHLDKEGSGRRWLKKIGYKTLRAGSGIRYGSGRGRRPEGLRISKIERFDEGMDAFWGEVSGHHAFIVERTSSYLNWRYMDPRAGEYVALRAEEDGRVLGYTVLSVRRPEGGDYPVGNITDLLTLPRRLDVAGALVGEALDHFSREGINVVECLFPRRHPYGRVLKGHGFMDVGDQGRCVWYYHLGLEGELGRVEASPPDRVHLTLGDISY